jgi:hypothetical protein
MRVHVRRPAGTLLSWLPAGVLPVLIVRVAIQGRSHPAGAPARRGSIGAWPVPHGCSVTSDTASTLLCTAQHILGCTHGSAHFVHNLTCQSGPYPPGVVAYGVLYSGVSLLLEESMPRALVLAQLKLQEQQVLLCATQCHCMRRHNPWCMPVGVISSTAVCTRVANWRQRVLVPANRFACKQLLLQPWRLCSCSLGPTSEHVSKYSNLNGILETISRL